MEEKITLRLFLMGICAAVLAAFLTGTLLMQGFTQQVKNDLKESARVIVRAYDGDVQTLAQYASNNLRLTLIAPDGTVSYESGYEDTDRMDNHAQRPEIVDALSNGTGEATRESDTVLTTVYYYAMRLDDGSVLRTSIKANMFYDSFDRAYPYITGMLFFIAALSILMAVWLTRGLLRPVRRLASSIDAVDVNAQESNAIYKELVPFVEQIQSQHKKIQFQLTQLEEERIKIEHITTHMSEGLVMLDAKNRILAANKSARSALRLPDTSDGENLLYVSNVEGLHLAIAHAQEGQSYSSTINSAQRILRIYTDPVVSSGVFMGIVLFMVDVTETTKIERMRQEFTANVSHELKTPLTSISGYAQMIEAGIAKPEDIADFAQRIHKEATRMLSLIGDIMRLSQLDEGGSGTDDDWVSLAEIVNEEAEALELSAQKREVDLHVSVDESMVQVDRTLLRELVHNLCDNAIRYNRQGGQVDISVKDGVFKVNDTGIGIAQENIDRVFERFYRVDKSRSRETGGTGLGLAIVRHVSQLYGAKIELSSTVGKGTCVTVRFKESSRD